MFPHVFNVYLPCTLHYCLILQFPWNFNFPSAQTAPHCFTYQTDSLISVRFWNFYEISTFHVDKRQHSVHTSNKYPKFCHILRLLWNSDFSRSRTAPPCSHAKRICSFLSYFAIPMKFQFSTFTNCAILFAHRANVLRRVLVVANCKWFPERTKQKKKRWPLGERPSETFLTFPRGSFNAHAEKKNPRSRVARVKQNRGVANGKEKDERKKRKR